MKVVNAHVAKTTPSQLLTEAEQGEDVVIARNGVPVARLSAVHPAHVREPGLWRKYPGWEGYVFDPHILGPRTDAEIEAEGWL